MSTEPVGAIAAWTPDDDQRLQLTDVIVECDSSHAPTIKLRFLAETPGEPNAEYAVLLSRAAARRLCEMIAELPGQENPRT